MNSFFLRLSLLASGRNILYLLGLYLPFPIAILPQAESYIRKVASNPAVTVLDLQFDYSSNEAFQTLLEMGEVGRSRYWYIEWSIDILYPMIYASFFGLLLVWLLQKINEYEGHWRHLTLVPFMAMLFDMAENICITTMIHLFDQGNNNTFSFFALLANTFGGFKWASAFIAMASILLLFIICGFKSLLSRTT